MSPAFITRRYRCRRVRPGSTRCGSTIRSSSRASMTPTATSSATGCPNWPGCRRPSSMSRGACPPAGSARRASGSGAITRRRWSTGRARPGGRVPRWPRATVTPPPAPNPNRSTRRSVHAIDAVRNAPIGVGHARRRPLRGACSDGSPVAQPSI